MADIFREVDDEVRQDRVQLALSRYWGWLLLLALLVIAGVGAWRGVEYFRLQREQASGSQYLAALNLARDGKGADAIAALDAIAKSGTPGYAVLARFRAASELGLTDAPAAAKTFDALAGDAAVEPGLQDVARLRAAILLLDSVDLKTMRGRLQSLADANNPMRNPARELLALTALKVEDYDAAGQWLDAIVTDPSATGSARQRADVLLALVQSGKTAKKP